jgi:hypothetical protein
MGVPHLSRRIIFLLAIDVVLLAICFLHIPAVMQKARTPFRAERESASVVVKKIFDKKLSAGIQEGDILVAWGDHPIVIAEVLEFLGDLSAVGETVSMEYNRHGETRRTEITLISYYDAPLRFVIIVVFVGIVIWATGVFVLVHREADRTARALHWALISFATIVMMTWGRITPDSFETHLSRLLFLASYSGTISWLTYFTMIFPKPKTSHRWLLRAPLFAPVLIISPLLAFLNHC